MTILPAQLGLVIAHYRTLYYASNVFLLKAVQA